MAVDGQQLPDVPLHLLEQCSASRLTLVEQIDSRKVEACPRLLGIIKFVEQPNEVA